MTVLHVAASIVVIVVLLGTAPKTGIGSSTALPREHSLDTAISNNSPVQNFSAAINRIVTLVGVAGSGLLALVWARVALSWFSNDVTKKIQAKDRARDALIGTLLFVAALTGLIWALAQWVLTGS